MDENYPEFREIVKKSFIKAKEDINGLENDIKALNFKLEIQNNENLALKKQLAEVLSLFIQNKEKSNDNENISIGNEGVLINKQTNKQTHKQTNTLHINQEYDSLSTVERLLNSLTKKEFLAFLTVYQLEEDLKRVTYHEIAKHLKLTEACIRVHILNITKKGLPLLKTKVNNKLTLLYINPEFRELGLKTKLFALYNQIDSSQTTLEGL